MRNTAARHGPSTLGELLSESVEGPGDTACILSADHPPISRALLLTAAHAASSWLRELGVGDTTRVAVMLSDRRDMAVSCLCVAGSAGCVPLNAAHTQRELDDLFEQLEIDLVVSDAGADAPLARSAAKRGVRVRGPEFLNGERVASTRAAALTSDPQTVAFYLTTSGSSGTPKIVPLTHHNVCASADNLAQSLALTPADRAFHALPLFHVGGLVDLLLAPLLSGGSVYLANGPSAEEFFEQLERARPTWHQGVPTMLASMCDRAERHRPALDRHGLRLLRSVSSALPQHVYERCHAAFGVPVIEIYGMTETSGVITSNPLAPGAQKLGSVGRPVAGMEVLVVDDAGMPARALVAGEIFVRGTAVMRGYFGDAETTPFASGTLKTGDRGYFDADGYLFLTGRSKEMINRGGEKIAPLELDACLTAHPAVAEAASFAVPHPTLGEEPCAAVVLRPDGSVSAEDLRAFLAGRIADYKMPRTIHFVKALPKTASHKLRRHVLAEEFGAPRPANPERPAYRPATQEGIVLEQLWRMLLKTDVVHADDDFFDCGGDSIAAMTLITELEAKCRVAISPAILAAHPTIADLERALREASGVANASPARGVRRPDAEARDTLGRLLKAMSGWQGTRAHPEALFIGRNVSGTANPIYFSFDGAAAFHQLADALGPEQPVYGVRSLWNVDDRPHAERAVAEQCCEELLALQPQGPYILGGFCQGAAIAQRMASELIERGASVQTCVLVDPNVLRPATCNAGLILTSFGRLSYFQYYKRPEIGLRKLLRGGFNLYRQHCEHVDCFEEPDVARTAELFKQELANSSAGLTEHAGDHTQSVLPQGAHHYSMSVSIPKRVPRQSRVLLRVTVTNTGATAWPANQVAVCNRWPSLKTAAVRWIKKNLHSLDRVDGSTLIPTQVRPGQSVSVELKIRTPSTPRLATLELDLVEEGICWFQEKGRGRPLHETVLVF